MKLWIFSNDLPSAKYALERFRAEAKITKNIKLRVVYPEHFEIFTSNTPESSTIYYKGKPIAQPDVILSRVGSYSPAFSLALLRHFQALGITLINTASSISKSKDKLHTIQLLAARGLPIPKTMQARVPIPEKLIDEHLGYPLVLKAVTGSLGKGVMLCDSATELSDVMGLMKSDQQLIVQEFISPSNGKDLRVFVIGGRVIGCMLRTAKQGFKANASLGADVTSYPLNDEIIWLASEATRTLGLDIAGVDLLFDQNDGYRICEINAAPQFEGFERATGINIPVEIFHYLQVRLGGNSGPLS